MLETRVGDPSADPTSRYFNRELSWLEFNRRVLELAQDTGFPLLERAKFLAIFAGNLDEFYMVRVAGLKRQQAAGLSSRSPDGLTPRDQLAAIADRVRPMVVEHAFAATVDVLPGLAAAGLSVIRWNDLTELRKKELGELFTEKIFPVVTPLAVDSGHPFPYISNLSLNLAVSVRDACRDETHFARLKVPPLLSRYVPLGEEGSFVPLEDVIAANLDQLFPGMEVVEHSAFRVTRNADLEVNDDGAEDLLEALEAELRKKRFSPAVRLEVEQGTSDHVLELLMRELEVDAQDVHMLPGPLDLTSLWQLYALDRPDLKDEPWHPVVPTALTAPDDAAPDVFGILRSGDILVHHPYESFSASVQALIEQAAQDSGVLAIKLTLYRTSGDSPIVDALIDAAEEGKQVVVLVEIKARFDERNNINWARTLERAGCHVVYGLMGLKTHCKLCLIVRREGDELRRYVHVGTGNYNPKTARTYEDIGLLTSDPQLGSDISNLFNYLTGYSRQTEYQSLIVSPHATRNRMIELIRREASLSTPEQPGYIAMKTNSLIDEAIIDALYEASRKDVEIDLVVRGICSLRPGIKGLSERIRVRSILGRFLEHSRIFLFKNGGQEETYIGSADLMHRNLDRRVEVIVSVRAATLQDRLKEILELALADNTFSWVLNADGEWTRLRAAEGASPVSLQQELVRRASNHA